MTQPEGGLLVSRLTDEVTSALHGYVRDQEMVTTLTTLMNASDLAGTVSESNQISRGLVEIGDELLFVGAVDAGAGTFSVPAWGRGQDGSTAATHSVGAKVTQSPLYPRRRVQDEIWSVLREMFPRVYGVATAFFDVDVVRTNYALPSDVWQVFTVDWHLPGPSFMWTPLKRWRINHTATTQEIEMMGMRWPGSDRVRVTYSKVPPASYSTDDLTSYGYTQDVHDIIVLGATAKLLAKTEPSRLQVESVESHGRSEVVQAGTIVQTAQRLFAMYDRRVEQEAFRLQQRFTLQPHKTR